MKNKYFTPDMEDFHIGYECEISTPTIWKSGKFPEILELNSELDEFSKDSLMKAAHAILRVPYLTKEQIEAEGWTKEKSYFIKNNIYLFFEDKFLVIDSGNPFSWEAIDSEILFKGKCKDINTFRKICKLLEI